MVSPHSGLFCLHIPATLSTLLPKSSSFPSTFRQQCRCCSKSGHCLSPGQPLQLVSDLLSLPSTQSCRSVPSFPGPHLCPVPTYLSHHLSLTSTPSPSASILKYFLLQGLRTTTASLGHPSLPALTLPRSESPMSHSFSPLLLGLWAVTSPSQPGSPIACVHCIPGGLPPPWSWALPCPDFAECFLPVQKSDMNAETCRLVLVIFLSRRHLAAAVVCSLHSCASGGLQCAWALQPVAVFKRQTWRGAISSVASALTACLVSSQSAHGISSTPWSKLGMRRRQGSCPLTDKKLTLRWNNNLCKFISEWVTEEDHRIIPLLKCDNFVKEAGFLPRARLPHHWREKGPEKQEKKQNQINNNIKKNKT